MPTRLSRIVIGVLAALSLCSTAYAESWQYRVPVLGLRLTPNAPPVEVSCALPWGGALASGAPAVTGYTQPSVTYGASCSMYQVSLSCVDGVLTSPAQYGSCVAKAYYPTINNVPQPDLLYATPDAAAQRAWSSFYWTGGSDWSKFDGPFSNSACTTRGFLQGQVSVVYGKLIRAGSGSKSCITVGSVSPIDVP